MLKVGASMMNDVICHRLLSQASVTAEVHPQQRVWQEFRRDADATDIVMCTEDRKDIPSALSSSNITKIPQRNVTDLIY